MTLLELVNILLASGTVLSQVFIVLALIYTFSPLRKEIFANYFSKNGIALAFGVALVATCGSLFYSTYAGFVPCPLCWFQRIFMYPEVIILGLALIKSDNKVTDYVLSLSVIGWIISVYHNIIYFSSLRSVVCTSAESCTTPYLTEFGYVTIPVMALTAFSLVILILIFQKYGKRF